MTNRFCAHSSVIWCLFPSLLCNSGNKQNNPLVSVETARHKSTYIILCISVVIGASSQNTDFWAGAQRLVCQKFSSQIHTKFIRQCIQTFGPLINLEWPCSQTTSLTDLAGRAMLKLKKKGHIITRDEVMLISRSLTQSGEVQRVEADDACVITWRRLYIMLATLNWAIVRFNS